MHACRVIKFIWLVEGEVIHFMLGDIAIQFSVFVGSGAGGFIVYFRYCISSCNNIYYHLGNPLVAWGIRRSNMEPFLIWCYICGICVVVW